jgi:DNA-binding NtrC family response regulator
VRVLVVEDELRMAALLKRGLEEDGYAVDVASTGPDASSSPARKNRYSDRASTARAPPSEGPAAEDAAVTAATAASR